MIVLLDTRQKVSYLIVIVRNSFEIPFVSYNVTIGAIIRDLGEDIIQGKYRNAIFHSDFFLDYEVNYNERLITFRNNDGTLEHLSAKEFLSSFFKTFQLIFTFDFTLEYVTLLKI